MPSILPPARERIVLADALRGFALMGLFLVHMVEYFELYWYRPEPGWIHNLIFFLFGGKAYGIFALLFGLSFFIILDNYQKRGIDFRLRFCWRLCLLLLLGYLHSLLYAGDILQLLAICGFLLVLSHGFKTRYLVAIAVFFLAQVPQVVLIVGHEWLSAPNYREPVFYTLMGRNFEMFAHASLPDLIRYNIYNGQFGKWAFFLETGRLWQIIGLMYLGAALGRLGFFTTRHPIRRLLIGMGIAVLGYAVTATAPKLASGTVTAEMAVWAQAQLFAYYQNLSVIAAGMLCFVAVFQHPAGQQLLKNFAPAGRMTLTFYLSQSLLFVPVYYGFGFAGYARIGQLNSLWLGLLCWIGQILLAHWWLARHRYGPLEWLWRRLTFIGFDTTAIVSAGKPE